MRQLFPGSAQLDRVDVLYGAGKDTRTKTPTEKAGARLTCWKCSQKGHLQRDCPMKSQKSSTPASVFVAQGSLNPEQRGEERGDLPVATDVPNHSALTVVGHDVGLGDSVYPGVCFMVLPETRDRGGAPLALHGLCEATYGSGIIDLGYMDTLCGEGWLKHSLALLGLDSAGLHRRETQAWFVFGVGGLRNALYSVDLPIKLAGGVHFLRTHVVPGDTPLLVGRRSMTRMQMRVDTATNSVTVNLGAGDHSVPCTISRSGHLTTPVWDSHHMEHA